VLFVLAFLLAPALAGAQDLARLFPEEADVYVDAAGVVRLPLPPEVVAAASPDLADLRLFDRTGREVPYLVDPGVPSGRVRRERVTVDARVSDLAREEMPRDDARALTREVYRVVLPEEDVAGAWTLVADASQGRFVRRVEVRGVNADGSETVLVPRASLVRLGQPLVDRDRIPLPPFAGAEIVLTIEGEEGFFLEPVLRFERDRDLAAAGTTEVPLRVLSERHENGRTVLELERPPALVASRLRFASATPAFDRAVRVHDVEPGGDTRSAGAGRIARAPLPDGAAVRDAQLDVALGVVRGERLRVEIDDGDSPPLEDVALVAVVSQPALLFALQTPSAAAPAGVLRFGGRRAYAPRYDVADLFRDAVAASAELLADPARIPLARLGPIRANPSFDASPALAPMMLPGPAIEVDAWRWRRSVQVPPSPEGLVRIRLEPEDLAQARDDRSDVRVVDGAGRQWPYVFAPATERADVALRVEGPRTKDGRSTWRFVLPVEELRLDRLRFETLRPVLNRSYRLRTRDADGTEHVLAEGVLAQPLRRAGALTIAFPPSRVSSLDLEVDDGDDAPIAITRADAPVALPSVLVAAPAGGYTLLAGNPDAERPAYEIERAREVVLDLRSVPASAGAGVEHAGWTGTPGGAARQRLRLQQVAIWGAIVIAVSVLALLTLRLVRRPG